MSKKQDNYIIQKIIVWILICTWMFIIFLFSAQNAEESGNLSEGFLRRFVLWFLPENLGGNQELVDSLEHLVRKCAHMTEYAVLGLLISIQMHLYRVVEKNWKWMLAAVVLVMLYATTDELHQLFVGGRSGRFTDVCIDTAGGFLGTVAFCVWKKLTNKSKVEDKQ